MGHVGFDLFTRQRLQQTADRNALVELPQIRLIQDEQHRHRKQRTAERDALGKLIATMQKTPTGACQGAGSPTSRPVQITIDTTSHRKRVS